MRLPYLLALSVLLSVLATGCGLFGSDEAKSKAKAANAAPDAVTVAFNPEDIAEVMMAKSAATEPAPSEYTFAKRGEFVEAMKGKLDALQVELDSLSAQFSGGGDAIKADAKEALEATRTKYAEAKVQLDNAATATEETWDEVKVGLDGTYTDLEASVGVSRQWLSDQIAP